MSRFFPILIFLILSVSLSAQQPFEHSCAKSKIAAMEKAASFDAVQYPGDQSIDVTYYKLDLEVNYDEGMADPVYLDGTVTIGAKAIGSITSAFFDLQDYFIINEVKVNGVVTTSYQFTDDKITIELGSTVNNDEEFTVDVSYEGVPGSSGLGSFGYSTYYDAIWTLSEPYGAPDWWVSKDSPADKPDSADIWLTTSTNLIPASNGSLEAKIDNGDGTHTYQWNVSYPIAHYLISLAIAPYDITEEYWQYNDNDSMLVVHYNYPQNVTQSRLNALSETIPMLEVFSDLYGLYPFIDEKYGHAEFVWGGAMEHQTLSSMGSYNTAIIAHEMAHQWFGDMITCADWRNIWLNEGFAVYSESLYWEKAYGHEIFMDDVINNMNAAKYANGSLYVQNINSISEIFSSVRTYAKGGTVLHMLRGVIGDEAFFQTMYNYAHDEQVRHASAVTEDFQRVAEATSGMDLEWFFQQWIYGAGYPKYSFGWSTTENNGSYSVNGIIEQTQTTGTIFKMPIEFVVEFMDGTEESFIVWDSTGSQQFEFSVAKDPLNVKVDPNNWILKDVNELLVNPPLDKGVLLVNGLAWSEETQTSYSDNAYWGNLPITFWDTFDEPSEGYPDALPEVIGHGTVDIGAMRRYSTLLWISGGSDNNKFDRSLVKSYLDAGGNIVLLTNAGKNFLNDDLKEYLGINWSSAPFSTLKDFNSEYSGLTDIALTSNQVFINTFETELISNNSTLLYTASEGFATPVGVGVFAQPEGKGKFVLLTCKPNMFDPDDLSSNIEFIVANLLGEPTTGVDDDKELIKEFSLESIYPNPFNPSTNVQFALPSNELVNISVYNIIGQKVAELVNENMESGVHKVEWNASNLSSGVYLIRMNAGKFNAVQKAILVK